jgi:hypothetical protein
VSTILEVDTTGWVDARALRLHSRWAPKVCRSEPLFLPWAGSVGQRSVPNRSFIVRSKRNGPNRYFHGSLGERNQESANERIQTCEQSAAAISCATCSTQTVATPASAQGALELVTIWAGQNASLRHSIDATDFMTQLIAEAKSVFSKYWEAVSPVRETRDEDEAR